MGITNETQHSHVEVAQNQLELVLSFFPRVDTLLAAILGLDVAMLGVAFARAPALSQFTCAQALVTLAFLGASLMSFTQLYRGSFPNTDGGVGSLIFFQEVAKLQPSDYVQRFRALSSEQLSADLLHQAWRNSCILTAKFAALKRSYRWLLASAVPWALALLLCPPSKAV
ncbi:MAG TPA: Pycsar system effector family protein [Lysobacter sp.]